MIKNAMIAAAAIILPTVGHAAEWSSGFMRGIPFYTLKSDDLDLTIVCDPEGAYSPPQDYIQADLAGRAADGSVELRNEVQQVTLEFEMGTAFKKSVTQESWTRALQILLSADGFFLESSNKAVEVTSTSHPDLVCK